METPGATAGAPGSLKAKDSHTLNEAYMQRFEEGFAALGGSQPQPKYSRSSPPSYPRSYGTVAQYSCAGSRAQREAAAAAPPYLQHGLTPHLRPALLLHGLAGPLCLPPTTESGATSFRLAACVPSADAWPLAHHHQSRTTLTICDSSLAQPCRDPASSQPQLTPCAS